MIYLCISGWLVIGAISHIFWWTRSWDYKTNEIPSTFLCALFGPITFIMMAFIHGEDLFDGRVIIKTNKKRN